jgi:hypothetical protein
MSDDPRVGVPNMRWRGGSAYSRCRHAAGDRPTPARRGGAAAAPDVVSTLASQGMSRRHPTESMADYLKSEPSVYTRIVKDANIKPE